MNEKMFYFLYIVCSLAVAAPVLSASKPNVLFIAIDDFNDWGPSQLAGEPFDVITPNFDKLASRGILFKNAHCNSPSCNPSRASIMSGLHPSSTGVYGNGHDWRKNKIFDDILLLPEYFKKYGYDAIGGGKIYHANQTSDKDRKGYLSPRGWDSFFPSFEAQLHVQSTPDIIPGRGFGKFDWGGTGKPIEEMGDHKVVNWAIREINKSRKNPLFIAVGIYRPHMPWYIPDKFYNQYKLSDIKPPQNPKDWDKNIPTVLHKPRRFSTFAGKPGPSRGYAACITYADYELGRLMKGLSSSPIAKNTIVVIWTDHGWHLGEKEHFSKFTLWEESTRVPLVILLPKSIHKEVSTAVSLLDVYPTLLALAGLPRYRYIKHGDTEALFDHKSDPREFNNIAANPANAGIIKRLSKAIPISPKDPMPKKSGKIKTKKKKNKNKKTKDKKNNNSHHISHGK